MPRPTESHPVLRAASHWRERCLLGNKSVFTDKDLWTEENIDFLVKCYVHDPDTSSRPFLVKLEEQLETTPKNVKQLAAEMLWVMYLFPDSGTMKSKTKLEQIRQVWEWSGENLLDASSEFEALEHGIGSTGTAFLTLKWKELAFFIELMKELLQTSHENRKRLLSDPWKFAKWMDEWMEKPNKWEEYWGERLLRNILLYLLFPKDFEPCAGSSQKKAIVNGFAKYFGGKFSYSNKIELDQQISRIREKLVEDKDASPDFDFHDDPLLNIWRPEPPVVEPPDTESKPTHVWLFGQAQKEWGRFQEEEIIAIDYDLGNLEEFDGEEAILKQLQKLPGMPPHPTNHAWMCHEFVHRIRPGDHILVAEKGRDLLGYGIADSDYIFQQDRPNYQHVRRVKWKMIGRWALPLKPEQTRWWPGTLNNITSLPLTPKIFSEIINPNLDSGERPDKYPDEEALKDLFLSKEDFLQISDSLKRKKNIILEGPPGVGKTFIAKRLAYLTIGYKAPERVKMIQFHQSYAYEDFIQGYRPSEDGGFDLRNGVFYSFCQMASKNPENRYVFIIDEINRGNLSKIFGELMMLVESDKRGPEYALELTYSSESFHVPENLYLIGMMNTADRSLAIVDYALRRRFAFFRLLPAFDTDKFRDFLKTKRVSGSLVKKINDRFSALNETIRKDLTNLGPGFEIGHSYFCPSDMDDKEFNESWYKTVINQEIKPLLQEYWFDKPDKVDQEVKLLK